MIGCSSLRGEFVVLVALRRKGLSGKQQRQQKHRRAAGHKYFSWKKGIANERAGNGPLPRPLEMLPEIGPAFRHDCHEPFAS